MKKRSNAGFALIDLLFVCGIIGVISAIAIPRLIMAKQAAGAASAIGSLRTIGSSQLTYALTCGAGFYAPTLPDLGTPPVPGAPPFLSPDLTAGPSVTKSVYTITMSSTANPGAPATCNGLARGLSGSGYKAGADPIGAPSNIRYFASNSSGMIYEHNTVLYPSMPEVGPSPLGAPLK